MSALEEKLLQRHPRKEDGRELIYLHHPRLARRPNRIQVQNQVDLFLRGRLTVVFEAMQRQGWTFRRTVGRVSRPV